MKYVRSTNCFDVDGESGSKMESHAFVIVCHRWKCVDSKCLDAA